MGGGVDLWSSFWEARSGDWRKGAWEDTGSLVVSTPFPGVETYVYTAATALGTYSGLACGEAVYVLLQPALKETVFDLAKQSRDTFFKKNL